MEKFFNKYINSKTIFNAGWVLLLGVLVYVFVKTGNPEAAVNQFALSFQDSRFNLTLLLSFIIVAGYMTIISGALKSFHNLAKVFRFSGGLKSLKNHLSVILWLIFYVLLSQVYYKLINLATDKVIGFNKNLQFLQTETFAKTLNNISQIVASKTNLLAIVIAVLIVLVYLNWVQKRFSLVEPKAPAVFMDSINGLTGVLIYYGLIYYIYLVFVNILLVK